MVDSAEIGLTGLAVMGQNLARNIASRGIPVLVHNRTAATTDAFLAGLRSDEPLTGAATLEALAAGLKRPRRIIIMVKAGPPVDAVLDQLLELLEPGDVVIDGGNSFFPDTVRREQLAAQRGVAFLGVGISGGEEGVEVVLDRHLLGAVDDVPDHRPRVEVPEVQDLLVAVGVGHLEEAVLLRLGVHPLDHPLDHAVDRRVAVATVLAEVLLVQRQVGHDVLREDVLQEGRADRYIRTLITGEQGTEAGRSIDTVAHTGQYL
jgi:hypothetical protein